MSDTADIVVPEGEVVVSTAAAKRVAKILASEPDMSALRVSVEGGGCSGFSYKFDLTNAAQDDDLVLEAVSLAEGRREGQEEGQEWEGQERREGQGRCREGSWLVALRTAGGLVALLRNEAGWHVSGCLAAASERSA